MKTSQASIDLLGATSAGLPAYRYNPSDLRTRGESWGAVVAFGIWLRVGVAAVGLLLIGAIQLINGEHATSDALAIVAAAGALLIAAWHYARIALQRMEQPDTNATPGSSPAVNGEHGRSAVAVMDGAYQRAYVVD